MKMKIVMYYKTKKDVNLYLMKIAFRNIVSLSMAFLMLASTTSFTVDKHFCGKMLMDLAIFSDAESCGMEMHSHPEGDSCAMDVDPCCSDQTVAVEGQDELRVSFDSLNFDQQLFLTSFIYSNLNLFEGLPQQVFPFSHYTPPLLVSDIQILDQVFLILFFTIFIDNGFYKVFDHISKP